MDKKYKCSIFVCARWEADSISEWLTYYRYIGFDHVYLYCNDDNPTELFEVVLPFIQHKDPFITFHHFGLQGQQEQMYRHFLNNHIEETEYFALFDVDEFLLLRNHDRIDSFVLEYDRADAISFHWVMAGNNNYKTRPAGLAIRNFTRRSRSAFRLTKPLVRSAAVDPSRMGAALGGSWFHNIELILYPNSKIFDVIHNDFSGYYGDLEGRFSAINKPEIHEKILDTAFLFHIQLKSEEDLQRRYRRGVLGEFSGQARRKEVSELPPDKLSEFFSILNSDQNAQEELGLVDIWNRMLADAFLGQIVPAPPGPNLARFGKANQSSYSEWSKNSSAEYDSLGLINGSPTPRYQHHTAEELNPWWSVDLGRMVALKELRIFNRVDEFRDRIRNFTVLGGLNENELFPIFVKEDNIAFGGVDGRPFIWEPEHSLKIQFLKITLPGMAVMDFSQVEIYGEYEGDRIK